MEAVQGKGEQNGQSNEAKPEIPSRELGGNREGKQEAEKRYAPLLPVRHSAKVRKALYLPIIAKESIKKPIFKDEIESGNSIFPSDLFAFGIIAATI